MSRSSMVRSTNSCWRSMWRSCRTDVSGRLPLRDSCS